jgi:hypothetical protein
LNTYHSEYEIMTGVIDFFWPNGLKLLLCLTLIIPAFFVVLLVTGFFLYEPAVLGVIAIVVGYVAACVLDEVIKSRTVKILIASVAAIVSLILGYILVRSMNVVCDPVHDPGHIVCDPVHTPASPATAPTVITTIRPTTTPPMIFDPVHEPGSCGQSCRDALRNAAGTTDIVARKLDECLQNCYR